ncbi:MAG TPA: hypothetical protein VGM84_13425 [Steroidobacteraceae bacterium]|jgi:hypothetical protein
MKTLTATAASALIVASLAAPAAPPSAGWQKVLARKGGCSLYVPADWKVGAVLKSSAASPDGTASAVVDRTDVATTLAEVKPVIQGMYKPVKTFEDSSQRLWYSYELNNKTQWYVGVPVKGGICGAQLTVGKPDQDATAKKIAMSVAAD